MSLTKKNESKSSDRSRLPQILGRLSGKRIRIKKKDRETYVTGTVSFVDSDNVTLRDCEVRLGINRIETASHQVIYYFEIDMIQRECWKKV